MSIDGIFTSSAIQRRGEMFRQVPVHLVSILAVTIAVLGSGCAQSYPVHYRSGLDMASPILPPNESIGIGRFRDARPEARINSDPSKGYLSQSGPFKAGLTYEGRRYIPINELIQDLLIKELQSVGVDAKAIGGGQIALNRRDLTRLAHEAGTTYALGGQIQDFVFSYPEADPSRFFRLPKFTGNQTATLSLTLVRSSGVPLFEGKVFTDTHIENVGIVFGHTASVDKLLNIALKNVLRSLAIELRRLSVRQSSSLEVSVMPQGTSEGRRYEAIIILPERDWSPETIAVAALESFGISHDEASTLTENVRTSIVGTEYFEVVSRTDMERILREIEFQRSDACSETQCLVEMGRALAATKMVGGTVGKAGGIFNFTLRFVDVETGKIEFSVVEDVDNPRDLLRAVRALSQKLALKYAESKNK